MGRKVFQPELKDLADTLSVRSVNVLKRYMQHLKPDTGAAVITPDKQLHEWKKEQEQYRDSHPITFARDGRSVTVVSEPQQEQDVVALYHQLVGMNVVRGMEFF